MSLFFKACLFSALVIVFHLPSSSQQVYRYQNECIKISQLDLNNRLFHAVVYFQNGSPKGFEQELARSINMNERFDIYRPVLSKKDHGIEISGRIETWPDIEKLLNTGIRRVAAKQQNHLPIAISIAGMVDVSEIVLLGRSITCSYEDPPEAPYTFIEDSLRSEIEGLIIPDSTNPVLMIKDLLNERLREMKLLNPSLKATIEVRNSNLLLTIPATSKDQIEVSLNQLKRDLLNIPDLEEQIRAWIKKEKIKYDLSRENARYVALTIAMDQYSRDWSQYPQHLSELNVKDISDEVEDFWFNTLWVEYNKEQLASKSSFDLKKEIQVDVSNENKVEHQVNDADKDWWQREFKTLLIAGAEIPEPYRYQILLEFDAVLYDEKPTVKPSIKEEQQKKIINKEIKEIPEGDMPKESEFILYFFPEELNPR